MSCVFSSSAISRSKLCVLPTEAITWRGRARGVMSEKKLAKESKCTWMSTSTAGIRCVAITETRRVRETKLTDENYYFIDENVYENYFFDENEYK